MGLGAAFPARSGRAHRRSLGFPPPVRRARLSSLDDGLDPHRPRRTLRLRDARVEWLLSMHPVTADILVSFLGWFPSKAKALRRLNRLAAKGRIRLVGTVQRRPTGRPEHVFCRYRPWAALLHEVELTEFCLRLDAGEILRGPHLRDNTIRPDAVATINGQAFYVEWDRGSMAKGQMAQRFRLYEGFPDYVLWICPDVERRDQLRTQAAALRHNALFTTAVDAVANPHAAVWVAVRGAMAGLPRQRKGGV